MSGTHGHFICFIYIFMLYFVYIFFKSIRKMSTALQKTHCYSSLMKLCHAATRKYRPKSLTRRLQISGQADAECSLGPIS